MESGIDGALYCVALSSLPVLGTWAGLFFWARVAHAVVYTADIPFLPTPAYLVSWPAILRIGAQASG